MRRGRGRARATGAVAALVLLACALVQGGAAVACTHEEAAANAAIYFDALMCEGEDGGQRYGLRCNACSVVDEPRQPGDRYSRDCAGACCIDVINRNRPGTPKDKMDPTLNEHVYNTARVPAAGFQWVRGSKVADCDTAGLAAGPSPMCKMKACTWVEPKSMADAMRGAFPFPKRAANPQRCGSEASVGRREAACMVETAAELVGAAGTFTTRATIASTTTAAKTTVVEDKEKVTTGALTDGENATTMTKSSSLSLGATVGVSIAAVVALVFLVCCAIGCIRRRKETSSSDGDLVKLTPYGTHAAPPAPAMAAGYGTVPVALAYSNLPSTPAFTPTTYTEDNVSGFPNSLSVCYAMLPAKRAGRTEPSGRQSPLHLALAVDTSQSGSSSVQSRTVWSEALARLLDALNDEVVEKLTLSLVSFAGDDAYESKIDLTSRPDRVDAYKEAILDLQPPPGEGFRSKARATAHIKAVDACHRVLSEAHPAVPHRRRILLVTASGVSDGETQMARSHGNVDTQAPGWQPPPGVVVIGVTRETRKEALVQLGGTAVVADAVHVLGTVAGVDSCVRLIMASN